MTDFPTVALGSLQPGDEFEMLDSIVRDMLCALGLSVFGRVASLGKYYVDVYLTAIETDAVTVESLSAHRMVRALPRSITITRAAAPDESAERQRPYAVEHGAHWPEAAKEHLAQLEPLLQKQLESGGHDSTYAREQIWKRALANDRAAVQAAASQARARYAAQSSAVARTPGGYVVFGGGGAGGIASGGSGNGGQP